MSNVLGCCCETPKGYYILQPCHLSSVTKKYMSTSDWSSCGFDYAKVYKNGYCGYWRPSSTAGDTLDNTCGNYTENSAGCCGGPFDPCPDTPDCCGYQDCLEYREANSQPVPLNLLGYLATTGSAGSSWTASVTSVTVGTPTFYNAGTADFRYLVSGTISVSWTADPGGTIDCDGSARPPSRSVPFQFYVVHAVNLGCPLTATAASTGDPCDYSVAVCPGTTTTTGSGFTACDILRAEPDGISMTTANPAFDNDCTPPNSSYRVAVSVDVDLLANSGDPDRCVTGCTSSGWASAYFPDVNASLTIILTGLWQ